MTDARRTCDRCGSAFTWSEGEQAFFQTRGLPDPPRRCAPCRRALKAERRESRPPDRPAKAPNLPTCSWCGEPARVPFTVAAHRPVACEACYRWRLGASSGSGEATRP